MNTVSKIVRIIENYDVKAGKTEQYLILNDANETLGAEIMLLKRFWECRLSNNGEVVLYRSTEMPDNLINDYQQTVKEIHKRSERTNFEDIMDIFSNYGY